MRQPFTQAFHWESGKLSEVPADGREHAARGRLPEGAYTTLRVYPGRRVLRPDWHARRLTDSTGVPLDVATLRSAAAATLRAAGRDEARLRITWAPPSLRVSVSPFEAPPAGLYREGARCIGVDLHRDEPGAKDARFIARASAAYAGLPEDVHEGLLLGPGRQILEGLSSNVFAVLDGVLRTAGSGVLPGITRGAVLEVARQLVEVEEQPVTLDDLPRVSEMFLTSASRGVLPVSAVGDRAIGAQVPGPLTQEIAQRFDALVERELEPI